MVLETSSQYEILRQQEEELANVEQQIQIEEQKAQQATKQPIPQKRFGSGVTKEQQLAVKENRERARQFLQSLKSPKSQIDTARTRIESARSGLDAYEQEKVAYSVAKKHYLRNRSSATLKRLGEDAKVIKYVQLFEQTGEEQAEANALAKLNQLENQLSQTLAPSEREKALEQFRTSPEATFTFDFAPIGEPTPLNIQPLRQTLAPKEDLIFSQQQQLVKPPTKEEILKARLTPAQFAISQKQYLVGAELLSQELRYDTRLRRKLNILRGTKEEQLGVQALQFGAGVIASTIGTVRFVQQSPQLAKQSLSYSKELITGQRNILKDTKSLGSAIQSTAINIKVTAQTKPFYAIGFTTSEIAQAFALPAAAKGAVKVTDITRTIKLRKAIDTDIIAPEYFKGQTFPAIKKGQTAGELLAEFKKPPVIFTSQVTKLKGYTGKGQIIKAPEIKKLPFQVPTLKGAGFTTAPKPLTSLTIKAGYSELPGLYTAPRVSPHFLRVKGEKKRLIGLSPFPTLRPTAFFTVVPVKLLPKVKATQRQLTPLKEAQRIFEKQPKGKAIVPFVKTEKEAIIPVGTELIKTGKRFFFEFEGRRIPIQELTVKQIQIKGIIKATKVKPISFEKIARISSRRKIREPPLTSPLISSSKIFSKITSFKPLPSSSIAKQVSSSRITPLSSKITSPISSIRSPYKTSYPKSTLISTPRSPLISPPISTPFSPPGKPLSTIPKPFRLTKSKVRQQKTATGFRTFIKVGEKFKALPGIRARGAAIKVGEKKTLRTLRATFKIKPTAKKVKVPKFTYRPSTTKFREYKIRKGKKIPLIDTFIQRRGTRLGTLGEVREIQAARLR